MLYSDDGSTVLGTRTANGVGHTVDRALLAAGANSDLLSDFERQLRPTAWMLDRLILIDRHPKYTGLALAVGGSGNGVYDGACSRNFSCGWIEGGYGEETEEDVEVESDEFSRCKRMDTNWKIIIMQDSKEITKFRKK